MSCFCIGPQNGEPRCPCKMNRRHDDEPRKYFVPREDEGKCLFDGVEPGKVMHLSCPCPKCTPTC